MNSSSLNASVEHTYKQEKGRQTNCITPYTNNLQTAPQAVYPPPQFVPQFVNYGACSEAPMCCQYARPQDAISASVQSQARMNESLQKRQQGNHQSPLPSAGQAVAITNSSCTRPYCMNYTECYDCAFCYRCTEAQKWSRYPRADAFPSDNTQNTYGTRGNAIQNSSLDAVRETGQVQKDKIGGSKAWPEGREYLNGKRWPAKIETGNGKKRGDVCARDGLEGCNSETAVKRVEEEEEESEGSEEELELFDLQKMLENNIVVVERFAYSLNGSAICASPTQKTSLPCRRRVANGRCHLHGERVAINSLNCCNGLLNEGGTMLLVIRGDKDGKNDVLSQSRKNKCGSVKMFTGSVEHGWTVVTAERPKLKVQTTGWSKEDHCKFLLGLRKHGRRWRRISLEMGNKSATQVQSHAQKFFGRQRLEKQQKKKRTIHDFGLHSEEMQQIERELELEES